VISAAFDYVRAESLEAALGALELEDAKAIAGGHSLIPMMKLRFARPSRVVDITTLGFRGVRDDGAISIGALTTYDELIRQRRVRIPDVLRECAEAVGDLQVRNAGTIGGGLAHADPSSDVAAGALALGAVLHVASASGERVVNAEEFFLGPFSTLLDAQELLTEIELPSPPPGSGSAYVAVEDPASGYPLAGAAVVAQTDGERLTYCAVGLTGITGSPIRARVVEAALLEANAGDRVEAIRGSLPEVELAVDVEDGAYKRHVACVVVGRALDRALARSEVSS
jgi:carbon-monoxide dehydrogenase medium subunit